MRNPYGGQIRKVRLDRDSVSGFVFWTKNLIPFGAALEDVNTGGYPFTVQYTINGYPRGLEPAVPPAEASVARFRQLADGFGPRAGVWRYDPILFTSVMDAAWHRENFARLAAALSGATDEVVMSFAHIYRKTRRNLDRAAAAGGFAWRDPDDGEKRELAASLAQIAADFGLYLTVCAQPELTPPGIPGARCIDGARLSDMAGETVTAKPRPNRPGCLCAEARDIGDYDSCTLGCAYCYAVFGPERARARLRRHDAGAEGLFEPRA